MTRRSPLIGPAVRFGTHCSHEWAEHKSGERRTTRGDRGWPLLRLAVTRDEEHRDRLSFR